MKAYISRETLILSIAFLFIFAGYSSTQQYVTNFFSQLGLPAVGFNSLILIYLFFTISGPFGAIIVSRFGAKRSMASGSIFYVLFIFSLSTKSIAFVYLTSILLGIAASLLWVGQKSYLVQGTIEENRGGNVGFFGTLFNLGATTGVIIMGLIIPQISYEKSFIVASLMTFIGFLTLLKLKDLRIERPKNQLLLLRRAMSSKTAWRLSTIWFCCYFNYGLVIGHIPIEIKNLLGILYVGILSSLFFITPIFLTFFVGKISDIIGRKTLLLVFFLICFLGLLFLYFAQDIFLLTPGILLMAIFYAMGDPLTHALIGDITTERNLDYLSAFFIMANAVSVTVSLLISSYIQSKSIYLISFGVLLITLIVLKPLFKLKLSTIREKLAEEVN